MFSFYFAGVQQDFKIAILPPILCALFRLAFILIYRDKKTPSGEWRKWLTCFRYGFWWGMDFNAYVFLYSMVLVSIPGAFFASYYTMGDTVRQVGLLVYAVVLYTAFIGRLIFYYHFHDIYNHLLLLGRHADKKNFADIFFNQNHGIWVLLSYIPYVGLCYLASSWLLALPSIPYPTFDTSGGQYAFNTAFFLAAVAIFYWFRYGGTFRHRRKPEWDEVPAVVKDDVFMGKAVIDDLIILEKLWHQKLHPSLQHSDEEALEIMKPILPPAKGPMQDADLLRRFERRAQGARIRKPSHIFFLLLESHAQCLFDPIYDKLNLMEGSKSFRKDIRTISMDNFLPGGMISQPSIVSLMSGIFDTNMELNENQEFWKGTLRTSMPCQLHKLGYRTSFWYGGALTWSSLDHYVPSVGFDRSFGGPDICGKDAPKTWLGVHDHIFLNEVARRIEQEDSEEPEFHFIYTTSNHGPYLLPFEQYGFNIDEVMPEMPEALRRDTKNWRRMASAWYADQSAMKFIDKMKELYSDSLFVVTGDHAAPVLPLEFDIVPRHEPNLREHYLTSFAMYHPELKRDMFSQNTIGCHMNILPTLLELIAPKDFCYYAIQPSLLEPINHVVTPYCWLTPDTIGSYGGHVEQKLAVSEDPLPIQHNQDRFVEEQRAWCELTGWFVRHPEVLRTKL